MGPSYLNDLTVKISWCLSPNNRFKFIDRMRLIKSNLLYISSLSLLIVIIFSSIIMFFVLNRPSVEKGVDYYKVAQGQSIVKVADELNNLGVLNNAHLTRFLLKIFGFEDVNLEITDGALEAIATLALERRIGARGLRSILEEVLLEVMYEIPGRDDVISCVINEDVVSKTEPPKLILRGESGLAAS